MATDSTALLYQIASSASLDPPRAWVGNRPETKKWAALTNDDIVVCCTADDVCEPAPFLTRLIAPRKVFGNEMVFAAGRGKLDLIFARIATKIPETNAVLLNGAIVANLIRKGHPNSSLVALTFGAALNSNEFARTVVVYAFLSDGKIVHDVYEAVRDVDGLKAQVSASGGKLYKCLQEDHTKEVTIGKRTGAFLGIDAASLICADEAEVKAAATAMVAHRYFTSSVRAQSAVRNRVVFASAVAIGAGCVYGYGFYLKNQASNLLEEARALDTRGEALAKDTDKHVSERHRAYATSVGARLPAALEQVQRLVLESPGSKIVLVSQGGRIRYEQHIDRVVVLTPGASQATVGVVADFRSYPEYVAGAQRETNLEVTAEPLALSRNSDRVVKGFKDENNSARFSDSVVRSIGL